MYAHSPIISTGSIRPMPMITPQVANYWPRLVPHPHMLYQPLNTPIGFHPFSPVPSYGPFWNTMSPPTTSFSTPSTVWNPVQNRISPAESTSTVSSGYNSTSNSPNDCPDETPVRTRKRRNHSEQPIAKRQKSPDVVVEDVKRTPDSRISKETRPNTPTKQRPRIVLGKLGKRRFILRLMAQ